MTPTAPPDPPMPDSYEQARTELATIVRALEGGTQTLEESLALWERGEALATACDRWLQAARDRLAAAQGAADNGAADNGASGDAAERRAGGNSAVDEDA